MKKTRVMIRLRGHLVEIVVGGKSVRGGTISRLIISLTHYKSWRLQKQVNHNLAMTRKVVISKTNIVNSNLIRTVIKSAILDRYILLPQPEKREL